LYFYDIFTAVIYESGGLNMDLQKIDDYYEMKVKQNKRYIICSFHDLRVKLNLSKEEAYEFLVLFRNKLENNGYNLFFKGDKYVYNGIQKAVKENEFLVALK